MGVRRLLDMLRDLPIRPYACIIGEPTEMKVIVGHKGKMSLRCHVHGRECHSSLAPEGVNAVEYAAEVIAHLRGMAQRIAARRPLRRRFRRRPFDGPYRHRPRRHGAQHRAQGLLLRFRVPLCAGVDPQALLAEVKGFAENELLPRR